MTEERRQPVRLHEDDARKLDQILFILKDPEVGLCQTVKRHNEAIYGNGSLGIKAKLIIVYSAVGILALAVGADHPVILKLIRKFGGY
jgi:hypothetical protein